MLHCSWDMVRDRCNYFSFWATFCPFAPTAQKIKKLQKMKKQPGNIIILHKWTKNYNQMRYDSWDMVHDRCNCSFSLWAIFCPFTHLTAQKIKILKKWRKNLEIPSFYICEPKIMIRWYIYGSWDMVCDKCNYFSFWAIVSAFTPLTAQKFKILKKWKKQLEISSFYISITNIMIRWCSVPEIWCVTDIIIFRIGPFFTLSERNKLHTVVCTYV